MTSTIARVETEQAPALTLRGVGKTFGHGAQAVTALRHIDLFGDFTMAELVAIYNVLSTVHFEAGQQVICEGDRGEHMYIIVEGWFDVAREGVPIATLGRGAHFGEMALLNQRPRSATVTARERSRLLLLDRQSFHTLMTREPETASPE